MWGCCEPMRTLGRPPRPLRRALSHPQWNPALGRCWQDSCGPHPIWNQSVCVNISNTFITFTYQIDVLENMQDKLLMLFKFWWGLCLLMCIFVLIYHIHFTVKFSYTPISHILVISNVWFGTDAQTIFPPMGAQITSIVFTPMRSELKKLNWSTYPLSRILSPFPFWLSAPFPKATLVLFF